MKGTKVELGIACAPNQTPAWWTSVMALILSETHLGLDIARINTASAALTDWNKNNVLQEKRRASLTDANRQEVTKGFLAGDAEWLFWIDDDTCPPLGAISHLIALRRPFVAGLYFLPKPPHNPIAYLRAESGMYNALWDYPKGALVPVDSVGMGCTLIHRSVYEKIQAEHLVYQRPDGSLFPIHKSQVHNTRKRAAGQAYVKDGALHQPVIQINLNDPDDNRTFPFYALEYGRTEDHHFCELAAAVGIRPWVDTSLVCEHLKTQPTKEADYLRAVSAQKSQEGAPS